MDLRTHKFEERQFQEALRDAGKVRPGGEMAKKGTQITTMRKCGSVPLATL